MIATRCPGPGAGPFTQHLKGKGLIIGERQAGTSAYLWRRNDPSTHPAPAVLRAPAVTGPFDPPPTHEGANSGMTEATAEWLFRKLGGRDVPIGENGMIREINPMEAHGWRVVADKLIKRLLELGMRGPGPGPDVAATWSVPWNYNIGDWAVQDEAGGFVAHLCDSDAAYLITAAPAMRNAILAVLERYDSAGGIKRADIESLRAALPKTED